MFIREIDRDIQGQGQKLAAINNSDQYLWLSRYYSLKTLLQGIT